jgi:hypothetical protein
MVDIAIYRTFTYSHMTILYMSERTVDSTDFADFLREFDDYVAFVLSANEVEDWAANNQSDIVVLYEREFAKEAEQLKGRFVTIERKPDMESEDVVAAINQALPNLSTRKSLQ